MTGLHLYRRLLDYVRPYWWAFALAVLGMPAIAVTAVEGAIGEMLESGGKG